MSTSDPDLPEVFPPTLREVLLRPRWLGMLAVCLVVAGVFAWLGQWQLGLAIQSSTVEEGHTEQVLPIDEVVAPGAYLNGPLVGQMTEATGRFVPGDFIVVSERMNDDVQGYWVTGQLRLDDTAVPTSLAVAVGWAPTIEKAQAAASALNAAPAGQVTVTGRLISDEGPKPPPHDDPTAIIRMSPAALLSRWHDIAGLDVYRPYLAATEPMDGLVQISSHPPQAYSSINWLNLFYAAEWVVFAGFAFYLWYRLARDAWEKECEELAEAATAAGEASGSPPD